MTFPDVAEFREELHSQPDVSRVGWLHGQVRYNGAKSIHDLERLRS